ncbi:MAG: hypothetical protein K2N51_15655 [Lachnospiraceae bacterium]|nr:hypothetical protein [Lachnospiraceae bacterium]
MMWKTQTILYAFIREYPFVMSQWQHVKRIVKHIGYVLNAETGVVLRVYLFAKNVNGKEKRGVKKRKGLCKVQGSF